MKSQGGVKIKIGHGLSNSYNNPGASSSRSDSSTSKGGHRGGHSSQGYNTLDTPCPTATLFDLCKTTNDPTLYKKRKTKSKVGAALGEKGDGHTDRVALGNSSSSSSGVQSKQQQQAKRSGQASEPSVTLGPQVEIINGKIVIRESSLMVPVHGPVTHEDFEEVEEGTHPTAKYSSFTKNVHSHVWGIEETRQFYEAIRQCGTDFSLMQAFFPHRTRKQLKFKFMREEKQHPMLIKASLTSHLPLDLAPFEVHLGSIDTTAGKKNSRSSSGSGKRELKGDESDRSIKKHKTEMQSDSDDDEEIIEDDSFNNYDDSFKSKSYKDRKSQNAPNPRHASTPSNHSDADSSAGPLVDV